MDTPDHNSKKQATFSPQKLAVVMMILSAVINSTDGFLVRSVMTLAGGVVVMSALGGFTLISMMKPEA